MSFGDWEMFKVLIISLREQEITNVLHYNEMPAHKSAGIRKASLSKTSSSNSEKDERKVNDGQRKQSVIEKQVMFNLL